ncbi:MAG: hypothetical protein AVDCRST_MAG61-1519 [uncultured Friedmanniella sp.]|uniref:Solute-binding protein family 3/N-terminal domain-containing protein n=1 Tax=uncultured Friedmanniella sp. TaxID=335381 RepID=A0A6J4KJV6_9ACTN|nr:transporter substrate-binding domain-containing protein [uncultured Friedmanniella sp.]CAA9308144.1 MAG: hypothetical protein AVDCRST_MAG61-1519 [uncultured Friedmanniella sp.]
MSGVPRRWVAGLLGAMSLVLGGCGTFPADPDGTLDRVQGGVLRVGVSPSPPWTVVGAGDPAGIEPDLVRRFADGLQAQVTWQVGGEEMLIGELEHHRLDLVVGGLTEDSPWTDKAAITKPYTEGPDPAGKPVGRVMAAPMGENAFLLRLEKFLLEEASR